MLFKDLSKATKNLIVIFIFIFIFTSKSLSSEILKPILRFFTIRAKGYVLKVGTIAEQPFFTI